MVSEQKSAPLFPFTAIVGQESMKRALLFNTINPKIGGVLIRGKKGTAKSTAVRSLAALLPEVEVLQGCPYSCPPQTRQGLCQWCEAEDRDASSAKDWWVNRQVRIVDLPVGATEDRLVGSLDIEQAIKTGGKSFEPGLIAAAHRGILYIDEVNLLNDHLVDVLLDAAAMGRNYVEREGISISHAAEFILVGTMNPEEGDLRPQLLDRFGLAVEVDGMLPPEERREVVKRRIAFEADPYGFMDQWQEVEAGQRERILRSRKLLPQVRVGDDILELITDICAEYQVDGLRGDIVMYKTAGTIAAYEGRTEVGVEDVREAAQMALLHRQRRQPFQQPHLVTEQLDSMIEDFQDRSRDREPEARDSSGDSGGSDDRGEGDPDPSHLDSQDSSPQEDSPGPDASERGAGPQEQLDEVGDPYPVQSLQIQPPDRRARRSTGRRATTILEAGNGSSAGRYVRAGVPQGKVADLALDATLRAAAPHQQRRRADARKDGETGRPAFLIEPWDLREKVRETKTGSLVLFVVDASGSMGAQRRMVAVKGAILSLLLDAYQRRDRVGLISFRGTRADLLLPPTGSVDLAQGYLREMPTGGRTPLGRGLYLALDVLQKERMKDRDVLPLLVLLSDGRANVTMDGPDVWRPEVSRQDGQGGERPLSPGPVGGRKSEGSSSPTPTEEAKAMATIIREKRIPSVVVDTEVGFIKLGLSRSLAEAMGAYYVQLDDLRADSLAEAVRLQMPSSESVIHGLFEASG